MNIGGPKPFYVTDFVCIRFLVRVDSCLTDVSAPETLPPQTK